MSEQEILTLDEAAGRIEAPQSGDTYLLPRSVRLVGGFVFTERAAAALGVVAGRGELWVKNTTPCTLIFKDDEGTEVTLGAGGGGSMTAAAILAALLTVDGSGSGLDADLLDGHDTSYFATGGGTATGTNTGDQTNITGNAATVTTNANLTGPVTSTGNATAIANGAISNAMLANSAVANLSGTNTGDQTNISGNAATVTTNANLTGHVTSVGNATVLGSFTVAQLNTAISDADVATGGGTATGTNTGDQTNISGNAATVTTNANLTGHVTSTGNAAVLGSFTKAQLSTAVSDGDPLYVGDIPISGNFTPTVWDLSNSDAEGQSYTVQTGVYRKIGDMVTFWIDITVNSIGTLTTTENTRIGGLPFAALAAVSGGVGAAVSIGFADSLAITAGQNVIGNIAAGNSFIGLQLWDATTGSTALLISELSAGARLIISGQYIAA